MDASNNPLPGVPCVESPFFDQLFDPATTEAETLRIARDLHEQGFAVLDFPDPEIDGLAEAIKRDLGPSFDFDFWQSEGHRQGISLRAQDAWRKNENVRRVACNPQLLDLLSRLYGRRAWPFQTLNFPVGTQQHFHSDSVHFSSLPERFMCGVWVALEDIDDDNGPLVYYPGSHRWPIYAAEHIGRRLTASPERPTQAVFEPMWRALVEAHGIPPKYFHARKGQALIWSANLMHGGARQSDPHRTRWSQVTHYFFDDCAYYTPLHSDPTLARIEFRRLTDISTGRAMPNRYAGEDIPQSHVDASINVVLIEALAGGFDPAAYLLANPDVAQAGVNAAEHFLRYGFREGRRLK
ncbi:MAG TPA: phytanoyl-CoA dioxygenase family protein [Ramlibacter sp.]|nr:phytanoyl-CoA dioxygenase family protein [Ramlibacter sp.]